MRPCKVSATRRISPWPGRKTRIEPLSLPSASSVTRTTSSSIRALGLRPTYRVATVKARPWLSISGASPSSACTRAPSSVADMTRSLRSSRRPCCASSAKARPRSASSERSWNSSNRTAATPSSAGSSKIIRVNTPSVTTSMRVRFDVRLVRRTRSPIVSPTFSSNVAAMRAAAARAARRRGSSRIRRLPSAQGSSSSASGARVVLPAPGGATSTAFECVASAERSSGSASSIGRSVSRLAISSRLGNLGEQRRRAVTLRKPMKPRMQSEPEHLRQGPPPLCGLIQATLRDRPCQ